MKVTFEKSPSQQYVFVPCQPSDLEKNFSSLFSKEQAGVFIESLKLSNFTAKKSQFSSVIETKEKSTLYIFCGVGEKPETKQLDFERLGATIYQLMKKNMYAKADIDCRLLEKAFPDNNVANYIASGACTATFSLTQKTKLKDEEKFKPEAINLITENPNSEKLFQDLDAVVKGMALTREVITSPPNQLYPETMAQKAKELEALNLKVEVFGEKELEKMGFHAMLGVGLGSEKETKLIVIQWNGADSKEQPVAFVGKGVTFDTGGISIKPSNGMEDMKYDMGGSGVVLGLMKTLALRKAKVNAVGVMGMAENMPSGSAIRPSDILKSLSGQTIEVLNTDAEGRLVLADALWYTQERFKPKYMIDLATLTGAIVVALGEEYAGLFSNNDDLAKALHDSGEKVGERVWQLPMGPGYDRDIDSTIADVKNIGSGRGAGSTTAAQFLQRFVNNTPWAHLDIAGVTWDKKGNSLTGKGATGFGVKLLNNWVREYIEG